MKVSRTCYTPRPCGPPRLVGLGHECCEVERCVHAMGWMTYPGRTTRKSADGLELLPVWLKCNSFRDDPSQVAVVLIR